MYTTHIFEVLLFPIKMAANIHKKVHTTKANKVRAMISTITRASVTLLGLVVGIVYVLVLVVIVYVLVLVVVVYVVVLE